VEVVPTKFHWEALYVATVMPLARGWERQVDEARNPLFYRGSAHLGAAVYRRWLIDEGVRFVALGDAPLDFAGTAEGRLVAAGVPGLRLVWRSAHWRLYEVTGSPGIVGPPARMVSLSGDRVVVVAPAAGTVIVRLRYNSHWDLASGAGCVGRALAPAPAAAPAPAPDPAAAPAPASDRDVASGSDPGQSRLGGGAGQRAPRTGPARPTPTQSAGTGASEWIGVTVPAPETFTLRVSLLPGRDRCRGGN
jgi:hypothetical protein